MKEHALPKHTANTPRGETGNKKPCYGEVCSEATSYPVITGGRGMLFIPSNFSVFKDP